MYRKTFAKINLDNLNYNLKTLQKYYKNYKYVFGVVKANAYNHGDIEISKELIKNNINYLAVSSIEEALNIRKNLKTINILCLEPINIDCLKLALKNNITITISSIDELKNILKEKVKKMKIHIKVDSGMNRLGIKHSNELEEVIKISNKNNIILEGIYTHMSNADSKNPNYFNYQVEKFKEITNNIDLKQFEIIHIGNSATLLNHEKLDFCNGIRLGIAMYGLNPIENEMNLKPVFSLHSNIIQIKDLKKGEFVGYNLNYKSSKNEKIAIIPIGYADGFIRKNTNRFVLVKDKKYKIIGNICMDMLMIKVDENVKNNDEVMLIGKSVDANYAAKHLETINYEVICSISDRVPKVYIKNNKEIFEKSNRFR